MRLYLGLKLVFMNKISQEWGFHLDILKISCLFQYYYLSYIVFVNFHIAIIIFILSGKFLKCNFSVKCT